MILRLYVGTIRGHKRSNLRGLRPVVGVRAVTGAEFGKRLVVLDQKWLVETGLAVRPSNIILGRGVEAGSATNRNSGKNSTFCFAALDPDNRFRFPPVSLFFDMCLWFWLGRGVLENLFSIEFAPAKVGWSAQNLHGPKMLNMENFGQTCPV